jgi:hypothetical protein
MRGPLSQFGAVMSMVNGGGIGVILGNTRTAQSMEDLKEKMLTYNTYMVFSVYTEITDI